MAEHEGGMDWTGFELAALQGIAVTAGTREGGVKLPK